MWENATIKDINSLTEFFISNLLESPQYISHGEMQMGIADLNGKVRIDAYLNWENYIREKINKSEIQHKAKVVVYKDKNEIIAFCVLDITDDGAEEFGVICDMLVKPYMRGKGLGKQMLMVAKVWFSENNVKDVYLESGLNNHSAHNFFEKNGFKPVSHIFKLY